MLKVQIIDREKKKEAQVLQDMSMTPTQRFIRMFDIIEFCIAFSRYPHEPMDDTNATVITLKKKV